MTAAAIRTIKLKDRGPSCGKSILIHSNACVDCAAGPRALEYERAHGVCSIGSRNPRRQMVNEQLSRICDGRR